MEGGYFWVKSRCYKFSRVYGTSEWRTSIAQFRPEVLFSAQGC